MRGGRFFWKLLLGNAALMAVALTAAVGIVLNIIRESRVQELSESLREHAQMARLLLAPAVDQADLTTVHTTVEALKGKLPGDLRITFATPDGTVVADTVAKAEEVGNVATREEVRDALTLGSGEATRYAAESGREMKFVALRMGTADVPLGVVRVGTSTRSFVGRLQEERRMVWSLAVVALVAVLALALGLAQLWSLPLRRIVATARSLSRGHLGARVHVVGRDELATLAQALNDMRDHLALQLETIDRQRRTLQALLAQLQEGVVVAGPDGRIVLMNPAALRLLNVPMAESRTEALQGLPVEHCVPQHDLQRMLLPQRQLPASAAEGHEEETEPAAEAERHEARLQVQTDTGAISLRARATDIVLPGRPGGAESAAGRLLVLTDISELTRAIQVKADFAANASHELRTPLSAIRASIETLLNMDLATEAASAREFLNVVERHSGRLEELVRDLFDLSRLEQPLARFEPQTIKLAEFLEEVRGRFAPIIRHKSLSWEVALERPDQVLVANPRLLQLVLDNLVDNALSFTPDGGTVRVSARSKPSPVKGAGAVVIQVTDTGCGIPKEEQARVFERFYQVERARTGTGSKGAPRGTGLGLSIVRHAVAAMRGTVELHSEVGAGTRVTVTIPQREGEG